MAERSVNNAMAPAPWPLPQRYAIQQFPIVRTVVQSQGPVDIPSDNNALEVRPEPRARPTTLSTLQEAYYPAQ